MHTSLQIAFSSTDSYSFGRLKVILGIKCNLPDGACKSENYITSNDGAFSDLITWKARWEKPQCHMQGTYLQRLKELRKTSEKQQFVYGPIFEHGITSQARNAKHSMATLASSRFRLKDVPLFYLLWPNLHALAKWLLKYMRHVTLFFMSPSTQRKIRLRLTFETALGNVQASWVGTPCRLVKLTIVLEKRNTAGRSNPGLLK
jgi:hypothetical protein